MSGMLCELQKYASTYAITPDNACVMVCMTDSAERLGVYVYHTHTAISYKDELGENAAHAVKSRVSESLTWSNFFSCLADACTKGRVELKAVGGESVAVPASRPRPGAGPADVAEMLVLFYAVNQQVIEFRTKRTEANMQEFILHRMIQRQLLHTYPKEHEESLSRLLTEESTVRTQSEALEREALSLKENLAGNRQQEIFCTKRLIELNRTYLPLQAKEKVTNPWEALRVKPQRVIFPQTSRISNPMGERTCKSYDIALLRLIKSRWVKLEECDFASPGNRTVQPLSEAELVIQTQNFSNRQREVVWQALDKIDNWDYNVFEIQAAMSGDDFASLEQQANGGSFFITMYALLVKYRFLEKFHIEERIALHWISMVEAGYHANPYHNSMHAADVLQITHFLLSTGGLAHRCRLKDEQIFAALLAAAIHDFDHPGINNNFHIKTRSYLATLYNDRSVLESLHAGSVFELMKNPAFNILESFSEEQRREIRETAVSMVLATDMGLHGKFVARLKGRLQEQATFFDPEDQQLALCMVLKMADISNCGRPLELYLKWSGKVSDEFYMQGDRERSLGLPCSPFMDRLQPALAKGQISFINYIIIPFFTLLSELIPAVRLAVDYAEVNKAYWAMNDDEVAT